MLLNKEKCGLMFLSAGRATLSADELRQKYITNVRLVAHYKYLSVFL